MLYVRQSDIDNDKDKGIISKIILIKRNYDWPFRDVVKESKSFVVFQSCEIIYHWLL